MNNSNWLAAPLLLLIGSGCATTLPVVEKSKMVAKNTEVLIGEFGFWKRDCSNRYFDIYIQEYPDGGDLRFEVGSLVIPEEPIIGSAGDCVGKTVQSKKVFYIPNTDFVGRDSVSYTVKSSRLLSNKSYDIELDVQ